MTKGFVLRALEDGRGSWISGALLAAQLGVSRQAVSKAVRALQWEGYAIQSLPRAGYRLLDECDLLSPEVISSETGIRICYRGTVSSTNDVAAAEFLRGGECAAIAMRQTAGRNKRGGSFESPENAGIYLSYAFPVFLYAHELTGFRERCGDIVEQVFRAVCREQPERRNLDEFFVEGKKVAGILVDVRLNAADCRTDFAVVGMGMYTRSILGGDCAPISAGASRNRIVILLLRALRRQFVPA